MEVPLLSPNGFPITPARSVLPQVLSDQFRIWYAIMLHDIKARFFGNGLGYLVTVLWPLSHILIILIINSGRLAPHGKSMVLYATTAAVPFIAASYVSRFMMMGIATNRAFLQYPIIKPLDLMIGRCLLELVNNYLVVVLLAIVLTLMGINVVPIHPEDAVAAWGAALFFGVGYGVCNCVIYMVFPMWVLVSIVFQISAWITCGISLDPELMPQPFAYYASFNPVMHAVEWMRSAYYPDFRPHLLNKSYLMYCAFFLLTIGLLSERIFRAFLNKSR